MYFRIIAISLFGLFATSCAESVEQGQKTNEEVVENNSDTSNIVEENVILEDQLDSSFIFVSATKNESDFKNLTMIFANGQVEIQKNEFQDNGEYRFEKNQLKLNLRSIGKVSFDYTMQDSIMKLTQNRQTLTLKRSNNI